MKLALTLAQKQKPFVDSLFLEGGLIDYKAVANAINHARAYGHAHLIANGSGRYFDEYIEEAKAVINAMSITAEEFTISTTPIKNKEKEDEDYGCRFEILCPSSTPPSTK